MVEPDLFGVNCEKGTTMKTVRYIAFIILIVVDKRSDGVDSIRLGGLCLTGCHLGAAAFPPASPQPLIAQLKWDKFEF